MKLDVGQRLKINENITQLLVDLAIPYDPNVSKPNAEDPRAYQVSACVYWVANYILELNNERDRIMGVNLEKCHARCQGLQDRLREMQRRAHSGDSQ
jgi:hypothetical protein